jgi:hypothetical protein
MNELQARNATVANLKKENEQLKAHVAEIEAAQETAPVDTDNCDDHAAPEECREVSVNMAFGKPETFIARLHPKTFARVDAICLASGITFTDFMMDAIRREIKRRDGKCGRPEGSKNKSKFKTQLTPVDRLGKYTRPNALPMVGDNRPPNEGGEEAEFELTPEETTD